jgi:hypothetical protein
MKSKKKSINRIKGSGIKSRKHYNMSGGSSLSFGNVQHSTSVLQAQLKSQIGYQNKLKDPNVIKNYLTNPSYGSKSGAQSYNEIWSNLFAIRNENITDLTSINDSLKQYSQAGSSAVAQAALPKIRTLQTLTSNERFSRIKTQDKTRREVFKAGKVGYDSKKDAISNELSEKIHELRGVVLNAMYSLVHTENNNIIAAIGPILTQSKIKLADGPGQSRV